jgi:Fe-S oxidoreductase
VPLPHLAEYTAKLTECFERNGTRGTWYAHASEGCLHVRPVLNLRLEKDVKAMRAIAEEAFELVRQYKGSHSGEHGDGLVRSEFHEDMFGPRLIAAFEEVKDTFDPQGTMNPGKIVRSPKFDERSLFRYAPDYEVQDFKPALDWSEYPGAIGGFQGAAEQCNNNGACRKSEGGAMCPSYRVTRDEQHVTRGRANTLRLAVSGQLGAGAFTSDEMMETMQLCVSCKACKRECPTGVDMARMKIEVLSARAKERGYSLRDRLIAHLPSYAPLAAKAAPLLNLRNRSGFLRWLSEVLMGFSAKRDLPLWRSDRFDERGASFGPETGHEVVLWADSFNAAFEPEILRDAIKVLTSAGYRVHLAALAPFFARGVPLVGLEPSCLFSFRDEAIAMLPGADSKRAAAHALLFEEFIAREAKAGRFKPNLQPAKSKAMLHGHCHQKAFGAMGPVEEALKLIPGLTLEKIESSCCGMAGAFGYQSETADMSLAMGELSLLPAARKADADTVLVADGTSCRHQIEDGADRKAVHVASLLAAHLA